MLYINLLHDWALLILLMVMSVVLYLTVWICLSASSFSKFVESEGLEILWTLIPILVLFALSLVSLRTLYLLDEVKNPDLTVKVVGHQWYWSYECDDLAGRDFDSYMIPTENLPSSGFRLLEVDKPLPLPVGLECRLLVLSEDVIHSWAVPSLGLKVDAVPGRLNQLLVKLNRSGILYGQCSEMCGAFHAFMPIKIEAVCDFM